MSNEPTPTPFEQVFPRRVGRRGIIKTVILSLIIFVCGGAGGWALAMGLHPPPPVEGQGMMPQPPVGQLVARLRDELLLTDDQVQRVTRIYEDRQADLHSIREEMAPRFKREYDQLRAEMQEVLTPPQFERWNRRFEDVRNRMLPPPFDGQGRGGPEHGPPGFNQGGLGQPPQP